MVGEKGTTPVQEVGPDNSIDNTHLTFIVLLQ